MQQRSNRLLKWLAENLEILPADARPWRQDVRVFASFLSTYLENSFDLDSAPGRRLYSPEAHCFCPLGSWFVADPHLTTK